MIPFVGLKLGVHVFEFDVDDSFFDDFEYALVRQGNLHVVFTLEKKETMMIGTFELSGDVKVLCDRCDDPMNQPVSGVYRLIYQFGGEDSGDENLVNLPEETYQLDLSESILEFITLALPQRNVHPKGQCNEEMIALLEKYRTIEKESEETDPRWQELNKLKTKNK